MRSRITIICLFLAATPLLRGNDWPGYLGPTRDAVSTETHWNTAWDEREPPLLWKKKIGAGTSSVSISGGRAYTLGNIRNKDRVYCLDALTGKEIWEHSYKEHREGGFYEGGPSATPTVHDGRVYTVSKSGLLLCLDAATGKVLWEKNYPRDFGGRKQMYGWAASPLGHGGALIVDPGGPGAAIAALDLREGETLWKNGDEEPAYASPVHFEIGEERGYALFQKTALVGYAEKTGAELFRFSWHTDWDIHASLPLFHGDHVFISSGYGTGSAYIDVSERLMLYRSKDLFLHFQHGIIIGDHLYAVSGDSDTPAELKCLRLSDGNVQWSNRYGASHRGNLLKAGAHLLVLTENGELILTTPSPEKYIEHHRFQSLPKTCWTPPALANALLYLRNNDGDLRCYDLRP